MYDRRKERSGYENTFTMAADAGYAASADAYYLNYASSTLPWSGADRWAEIAGIFNREQPDWTGVGKLIHDTRLILVAHREHSDRLLFINHTTGHRPPSYAAQAGYAYLDYWLHPEQ